MVRKSAALGFVGKQVNHHGSLVESVIFNCLSRQASGGGKVAHICQPISRAGRTLVGARANFSAGSPSQSSHACAAKPPMHSGRHVSGMTDKYLRTRHPSLNRLFLLPPPIASPLQLRSRARCNHDCAVFQSSFVFASSRHCPAVASFMIQPRPRTRPNVDTGEIRYRIISIGTQDYQLHNPGSDTE